MADRDPVERTSAGGRGTGGSRVPSPWSYVGLGFELAVPPLVGLFLGRRLDLWLGTEPWLLVVGALLGIAAGFLNFFRAVLPGRRGGGGPKEGPPA